MKNFKITNKFRFSIFILWIILFFTFIITNIFLDKVYSVTYDKYYEIMVVEGDTLWKIAKNNNPYNYDIRKVISKIMTYNNMKDAKIIPGEILKIPIK